MRANRSAFTLVLFICLTQAGLLQAETASYPEQETSVTQKSTRVDLPGNRYLAPAVSLLPGVLYHGLGASYLGYEKDSRSLTYLELIGLGLAGLGGMVAFLSGGSGDLYPIYIPLIWSGGTLFFDSYLFDFFGTIQPEGPLPSLKPRASGRVSYTYLEDGLNNIFRVMSLDGSWSGLGFYLRGRGMMDGDKYTRLDLEIDRGFSLGAGRLSQLYLGVQGGRESVEVNLRNYVVGSTSYPILIKVGGEFCLGDFMRFSRSLKFSPEVAYLVQGIRVKGSNDYAYTLDPVITNRVEWTPHRRIEIGVEHSVRPDLLIGQIQKWVGAIGIWTRIFPLAGTEILLGADFGDGYDVRVGIGYSIDRKK
ncbi:MAG: hypothetical protein NT056_01835 [Proteobacteria bacterium]|nr:hypothetical protein [Pseudomonadota bacterium]